MTFKLSLPALICVGTLSACGGSSSGIGFDQLRGTGERVTLALRDLDSTPLRDLPSGTATYEGIAVLGEAPSSFASQAEYAVVGASTVTVNFADADDIVASVTDLFEVAPESLSSDSDLRFEQSARAVDGGLTYDATTEAITGSITRSSGETRDYELFVTRSEYLGDDAEGLETISTGQSTSEGSSPKFVFLRTSGLR
ncbi:hypothetical protein [Yoonia sp. 208BN28-4]|uniref:hypothetical protein n=1 Tax=Yoonia sp. 208BN28-4 TaxID=3126505 RepID=UPI0030A6BD7E